MKLGFLIPHLGPTQAAFSLINNSNKFLKGRSNIDIIVFYENLVKSCLSTGFATMNIADAWNYPGNLVTTSLTTAHKSLRFPGATSKYFYVYDLEWVNIPVKRYENIAEVYQNPNLQLLARSDNHAKKIENAWGRTVRGVIREFDIESIINIIKEDEAANAIGKNKRLL